jgi:hypothetical protein
MQKKICQQSLLWILGVRAKANRHMYKRDLMNKFPETFTGQHSGGSMVWTINQAKKIDRIGLEQWLKTPDAYGYDAAITRSIEKDKKKEKEKDKKKEKEKKCRIPTYPIMK